MAMYFFTSCSFEHGKLVKVDMDVIATQQTQATGLILQGIVVFQNLKTTCKTYQLITCTGHCCGYVITDQKEMNSITLKATIADLGTWIGFRTIYFYSLQWRDY